MAVSDVGVDSGDGVVAHAVVAGADVALTKGIETLSTCSSIGCFSFFLNRFLLFFVVL